MSGEFTIEVDAKNDLVRIRMSGFFGREDIESFLRARRDAHRRLICGPNAHVTLNDLRGMKIQSLESVIAFRDMLAAPEYRSRRLAFVVAPTLAQGQLRRALAGREARCFEDPVEAETWLLSDAGESQPRWRAAG